MKRLLIQLSVAVSFVSLVLADEERSSGEGKKTTESAAPCPQWYADNEWSVSVWGAYAFNGEGSAASGRFTGRGRFRTGYLGTDDAWGGGLGARYFFQRYFGVGIEGYVIHAQQTVLEGGGNIFPPSFVEREESHAIGSILGTFTLRYPLPCSRLAPYAYSARAPSSAAGRGMYSSACRAFQELS